jgi:hypothetical protein
MLRRARPPNAITAWIADPGYKPLRGDVFTFGAVMNGSAAIFVRSNSNSDIRVESEPRFQLEREDGERDGSCSGRTIIPGTKVAGAARQSSVARHGGYLRRS